MQSDTVASSASPEMSLREMRQPRYERRMAVARPIPEPAPVMRTTLLARSVGGISGSALEVIEMEGDRNGIRVDFLKWTLLIHICTCWRSIRRSSGAVQSGVRAGDSGI